MSKRGNDMQRGEGERLYAEQRKRFWTIMGGLLLIGCVAGFASGFVVGSEDGNGTPLTPVMATFAGAGVVLLAIMAAYGSWRFFVEVDELEVADNLWGSLIGFYTYTILFPAWWALHQLGKAPEPEDWIIFGAAMVTAVAAYAWRKIRFN